MLLAVSPCDKSDSTRLIFRLRISRRVVTGAVLTLQGAACHRPLSFKTSSGRFTDDGNQTARARRPADRTALSRLCRLLQSGDERAEKLAILSDWLMDPAHPAPASWRRRDGTHRSCPYRAMPSPLRERKSVPRRPVRRSGSSGWRYGGGFSARRRDRGITRLERGSVDHARNNTEHGACMTGSRTGPTGLPMR